MKLDRNINGTGRGKYGLVNNRKLQEIVGPIGDSRNAWNMDEVNRMKVREAVQLLEEEGIIDWGAAGTASEFFVIKLRDESARAALYAYGEHAANYDPEYACEIEALMNRAGPASPFCKKPD